MYYLYFYFELWPNIWFNFPILWFLSHTEFSISSIMFMFWKKQQNNIILVVGMLMITCARHYRTSFGRSKLLFGSLVLTLVNFNWLPMFWLNQASRNCCKTWKPNKDWKSNNSLSQNGYGKNQRWKTLKYRNSIISLITQRYNIIILWLIYNLYQEKILVPELYQEAVLPHLVSCLPPGSRRIILQKLQKP